MSLQRNFSFQSHDDDPSYHPLSGSSSSPRSPPRRRPAPPVLLRRVDSSSSSESDSTESSLSVYPAVSRRAAPAVAAMAALAPPSTGQFVDERGQTPLGGFRQDERFWGREIGYSPSISSTGTRSAAAAGAAGGAAAAGAAAAAAAVATVAAESEAARSEAARSEAARSSTFDPGYQSSAASAAAPLLGATKRPDPSLGNSSPERILTDPVAGHYTDNPYKRFSTTWNPSMAGAVDGSNENILSDDDEPGTHGQQSTGVMATLGGMVGRKPAPVVGATALRGGYGGDGSIPPMHEKSEWLKSQTRSRRRNRWLVGGLIMLLFLGMITGIVLGVVLSRKQDKHSTLSAVDDVKKHGILNKDSDEIKKLMNNPELHKVFHGIDYTPLNAEYPDCLSNPPTQNNITRDLAVMSQLTSKLRLYGTDCNQTQMVLHAIDALEIDMKVWLGVWLDTNQTTNARQVAQLYELLDDEQHIPKYEGIAVGNEVLFRGDLSESALLDVVADVKANVTSRSLKIPVGTSDLGSAWTTAMASKVDLLLANIHPFFAGVTVDDAASWTWQYFQATDVSKANATGTANKPRAIISEVGWPSGGGTLEGSVAGIDEMNQFMSDFVCTSNANNTEYFWFEAFDEPWKQQFNTPGKAWEDKWGLLDMNRDLKAGVKIPDCKS